MCGRYASIRSSAELAELFDALDETEGALVADYNVAPTDAVPMVRAVAGGGRVLRVARWGLVPHWARDTRGAARMINARAETVGTSSAYRHAFAHQRCLLPADGWYEWGSGPYGRQAYFLTSKAGQVLAFAGIYARWRDLITCCVITVPATGELARVHHRMPLLVPPARWARWLADDPPGGLLASADGDSLLDIEIRPVGPEVGDVRNDGPKLITRVRTTEQTPQTLF